MESDDRSRSRSHPPNHFASPVARSGRIAVPWEGLLGMTPATVNALRPAACVPIRDAASLPLMATLIPSIGSANFDSRGELRLAERLKGFLEDNCYIWHNLPMGPRGRHPDFVIVHPGRGLLVLEVKDWRLDKIAGANKSDVELITNAGVV